MENKTEGGSNKSEKPYVYGNVHHIRMAGAPKPLTVAGFIINIVIILVLAVSVCFGHTAHAQENDEQLNAYLTTELPVLIKTESADIVPAGAHLVPDSIDIDWSWVRTGNIVTSLSNSISTIGEEGSRKFRFVQFTVVDDHRTERDLYAFIVITSVKTELSGSQVSRCVKTYVNPKTQETYAIMFEPYFQRYVHVFN